MQDGNGETAEPGQSKAPNACSLPAILNPAPSLSHDEAITTPPKTDEKPPRSYPSPDAEHRVASSAADTVLPRPGMPLTGLQTQWSGHRFLFSPLDEQPPLSAVRDQSPELDMTSAYAFNQSKAAAAAAAAARAEAQRAAEKRAAEKRAAEAAAAKKVILEALDAQKTLDASKSQASEPDFQIRGHPVGIKDLVEAERRAFTDEAPKSRKRKAADISSTSPEEETWAETALATASAAEMKDGTKEAPEVSSRQEEPPQAPEPSATPATVPVTTVADPAGTSVAPPVAANDRPFKKLRGAAEAFAYAAIGGAAVGVALVSALIATAPAI